MGRRHFFSSIFAVPPNSGREPAGLRPEAADTDVAPASTVGDGTDPFASNWENAWIDLGGEG